MTDKFDVKLWGLALKAFETLAGEKPVVVTVPNGGDGKGYEKVIGITTSLPEAQRKKIVISWRCGANELLRWPHGNVECRMFYDKELGRTRFKITGTPANTARFGVAMSTTTENKG
ncbi:Hypothetical protein POVN_LOCUS84 [uncultured virus]|nr:Hypothetical protein POVN_LOCUS84 [uncultured virus]